MNLFVLYRFFFFNFVSIGSNGNDRTIIITFSIIGFDYNKEDEVKELFTFEEIQNVYPKAENPSEFLIKMIGSRNNETYSVEDRDLFLSHFWQMKEKVENIPSKFFSVTQLTKMNEVWHPISSIIF